MLLHHLYSLWCLTFNNDVPNLQDMTKKNTIIINKGTGPLTQEDWDPSQARFLVLGLACT
jgi:hypothetical protein